MDTISLYIHFPFCIKKCRYCDFYSNSYDSDLVGHFINALRQEWLLLSKKYDFSNTVIDTIYCGGGTPSLLSIYEWQTFCIEVVSILNLSSNVEWSIECNPESFTYSKAYKWNESGVNRLIVGGQSSHDRELKCLGRIHSAEEVTKTLLSPILKNYYSIGVDIMYGIPGQTVESIQSTLKAFLSYDNVNHLSAYELILADNTPFGRHKVLLPLPSEREIIEMTESVVSIAGTYGLVRYEVSNYAKKGFECRHNIAYWNHNPYIGLGPSAHSYVHPYRFSNVADTHDYIKKLSVHELPHDFSEKIDRNKLERELIFLGLRTVKGIDERNFEILSGRMFNSQCRSNVLNELIEMQYIRHEPPFWCLTDQGFNIADAITDKLI